MPLMTRIKFPTCFILDQRQKIGSVTVDFIGGGEDKSCVRAITTGCLQQHQSAVGINREISEWFAGSPIMAWLCGSMYNHRNIAGKFIKQSEDGLLISNITSHMTETTELLLQTHGVPFGRRSTAKKVGPHIVINSYYIKPFVMKEAYRFTSNQPRRSSY